MAELTVNFKKIKEMAVVPTKGSTEAAGRDLYACIDDDVVIRPHDTVMIGTGIALQIPNGYFGGIVARSGLSTKEDLAPCNKFGVVDSDYTGEVFVPLHNHGDQIRVIHPNERIAQILILPYMSYDLFEVDDLESTDRGDGGFGSSGKF